MMTSHGTSSPLPSHRSVLIFDGACNLCNTLVDFVIRHDRSGRLRFASQESDAARRMLASLGEPPSGYLDTLVLIENGRIYVCSDAALRAAGMLEWPWRMLRVLKFVPRPIRDEVYRWTARRRRTLLVQRGSCRVMTDEIKARFL